MQTKDVATEEGHQGVVKLTSLAMVLLLPLALLPHHSLLGVQEMPPSRLSRSALLVMLMQMLRKSVPMHRVPL